jgi:hypothetical protein
MAHDFYIRKSTKDAAVEWLVHNSVEHEIVPYGYSNMLGYDVLPDEGAFIVHNFYRVRVLNDARGAPLFKLVFSDDLYNSKDLIVEAKIRQHYSDNQWTCNHRDEPFYCFTPSYRALVGAE